MYFSRLYFSWVRLSCISLLTFALVQASYAQLVGSWDFNEGSGSTFAGNLNGLDGVIEADTDVFSNDSPSGAADDYSLLFTGTETVRVDDPDGLLQRDADLTYTIECYIKVSEIPLARVILASYGLPGGYSFSITENRQLFTTTYGIQDISSETAVVPDDGAWHHVAVSFDFDNAAMLFYIDRVLESTIDYNGVVNAADFQRLFIGAEVAGEGPDLINPFVGNIDRLRIHNVVVPPEEFDILEVNSIGEWMIHE